VLRAVALMAYNGEKIIELISGYGEIWSAQILTHLFCQDGHDHFYVNARQVRLS
jgi:aspartokinase